MGSVRPIHPDLSISLGHLLLSPSQRSDHCTLSPRQLSELGFSARKPALAYKVPARWAAVARRSGWCVAAIAEDAAIDPEKFDLSSPRCRQLRRMLRKANRAGVFTDRAQGALPIQEMAALARDWECRKGRERGFSMSRFNTAPLSMQRVFLAHHEFRLVGFVTFRANAGEWYLDLMRTSSNAPPGTMHSLIHCALVYANRGTCQRFSLASAPLLRASETGIWYLGLDIAGRIGGGYGLRRFKTCFVPTWQRRYVCAPTRQQLLSGLLAVLRSIHHPSDSKFTHNLYDENEFE